MNILKFTYAFIYAMKQIYNTYVEDNLWFKYFVYKFILKPF